MIQYTKEKYDNRDNEINQNVQKVINEIKSDKEKEGNQSKVKLNI